MEKIDILIIGAGAVGLAVAKAVSNQKRSVFVIDKHKTFGMETSSRNSEVIHSGIYYPQGSLKHRLCMEGNTKLYMLCRKKDINFRQTGKFIVASTDKEIEDLNSLYVNGKKNGLESIQMMAGSMVSEYEPRIKCRRAIMVPTTGIIDTHSLMEYFIEEATSRGAEIVYNVELTGLAQDNSSGFIARLKEPSGEELELKSSVVINAAGLNSDKVAEFAGIDIDKADYRLKPCKGSYFRMHNFKEAPIEHLVYPVVEEGAKSLGIHLTPDLAGELRLGPDAEYVTEDADYGVDPDKENNFRTSVGKFLKGIEEKELNPDTSGIRPKLQGPGEKFRDFIIKDEGDRGLKGLINLIGIESPGITAAISIGEEVEKLL